MSSLHQWSYHDSLVEPSLARKVELYAGLQLGPANNSPPPSNPIDRFVDDLSTGAIVTHDTLNLAPHRPLMIPGDIAYSHCNPESIYQRSLSGHVDTESTRSGDNNSCPTYQSPTGSSTSGSLEEDGYQRRSSGSPSPEYPDPTFGKQFDQGYGFMPRPPSNLGAPLDPDLAPSDYVCPKAVQNVSNEDGQGQEGHPHFVEGEAEEYGCPQTMPGAVYSYYDRPYYTYDQPAPPIGYSQQYDHSLDHDHSGSSAQGSRQNSPTRALKLRTTKNRRNKCPPGMMKPFTASRGEGEKTRKPRAEKPRGRGAGKKAKERKVCREHPGKVFNHASDYKKHMNQQHLRPFLCVFYFAGCIQTFGSKNEWKRHVNSQHLQLSYWSCEDPMCADRKAIFNRKDLFGQHLKRMHPPPQGSKSSMISHMEGVIDNCRVERREPPQESRCGYCKQEFSGPQGWEQRMEHVGQHYEKNNYKEISSDCWVPDLGLIGWALEHGIIEDNGNGGYAVVSTGKDAVVKAGVERRKLAMEERAMEERAMEGYVDDDDEVDFDAEGDDEYLHT